MAVSTSRNWLRFSLRSLMLVVLLLCLTLGWLGAQMHEYRVEQHALSQLPGLQKTATWLPARGLQYFL